MTLRGASWGTWGRHAGGVLPAAGHRQGAQPVACGVCDDRHRGRGGGRPALLPLPRAPHGHVARGDGQGGARAVPPLRARGYGFVGTCSWPCAACTPPPRAWGPNWIPSSACSRAPGSWGPPSCPAAPWSTTAAAGALQTRVAGETLCPEQVPVIEMDEVFPSNLTYRRGICATTGIPPEFVVPTSEI